MGLLGFVTPLRPRVVLVHLGHALQLVAALLALPGGVALLLGEWVQAAVFAAVAVGALGLGLVVARGGGLEPDPREALAVAALGYLVAALAGALAFLPAVPLLDGLFESMSAFTTTGLSVTDPARLPRSLVFFRAWGQWAGGAGIAVLSVCLLASPGRAALELYTAEAARSTLAGSAIATARGVLGIYALLTALGFAGLLLAGLGPWDALLHALAAVSTGGFQPAPGPAAGGSGPALGVLIALMLLGALGLPLFGLARRRGLRVLVGDPQVRALGVVCAAGALLFLCGSWPADQGPLARVFQAVSTATTTGFAVGDPRGWSEPARLAAVPLMIVGGATGSTAGGLKLVRLLLLVRLGWLALARVLLPRDAVLPVLHAGQPVPSRELEDLTGLVALYLGVLLGGAALLALGGHAAGDALFESASALGTVGLSVGIASPDAAAWVKAVLVFEMWAGRLEIVPLLVLLAPWSWRGRRRGGAS